MGLYYRLEISSVDRLALGPPTVQKGKGHVPGLVPRVVPRNIVLRVKPPLVTPRVESRSLSLLAVVKVVVRVRIELNILLTVPVCVSGSVIRTPANTEIHASSVTALLLRRSVPVVRSPLKGPRARRSDR